MRMRRNDMLPWIAGVALFVAFCIGIWAITSPDQAGIGGLVLLAGLATIVFIAFYALATGSFQIGKAHQQDSQAARGFNSREAGLFLRVLDEAPEAYLIVERSGAVVFANQAYEDLAGAGNRARNMGRPLPLEQVFAGDEDLAAPLYRLARAARHGESVTEILRLKTIEDGVRVLRASVSPVAGSSDHSLWRIVEDKDGAEPGESRNSVEGAQSARLGNGAAQDGKSLNVTGDLAQAGLIASDDLLSALFDNVPVGLVSIDPLGHIMQANPRAYALAQSSMKQGSLFEALFVEEDQEVVQKALKDLKEETSLDVRLAGEIAASVQVHLRKFEHSSDAENSASILAFLIDTTEQKSLEMQYAQSQKMQAVGQLAGGVAHDFNNLLTAIIGFCDLLLTRHQAGDPSFSDIDQIRQNANRAANLVRQLLAFSRQQTLTPKVLSPTDVLTDLSMLLRRLLGETVELNMVHGRNLDLIKVDQSQLDTTLINLAVNARDAMPEGGKLTITSSAFTQLEDNKTAEDLIGAGDYVLIAVSDTGSGIEPPVLEKIFEPFFTTKAVGEGTGLGLSTVYGIIKQMDGFIFCDSELGVGTTFRIYLPVHVPSEMDKEPAEIETTAPPRDLTGNGTILLVEDEEAVRAFATRALSSRGYTVLEAGNGVEALEIFKSHDGPIDLMVSDVVMPEMDGPTLAKEARALKADTKIIFISGYAEDAFKATDRPENTAFLPKPFSLKQLAAKVKQVLSE